MKKSEIKPLFILTVIAILIIGLMLIIRSNNAKKSAQNEQSSEENTVEEKYVQVLNDGTKLNDSEKLNKDRSFEGQSDIELSNIQLTSKDGITNLLCDVKNNSSTFQVSLKTYNQEKQNNLALLLQQTMQMHMISL